jgi:hypothetical protein
MVGLLRSRNGPRDRPGPRSNRFNEKKAIESRYTAAEEFANAGVDCWQGHSLVPTPLVAFGTICVLFVVRARSWGTREISIDMCAAICVDNQLAACQTITSQVQEILSCQSRRPMNCPRAVDQDLGLSNTHRYFPRSASCYLRFHLSAPLPKLLFLHTIRDCQSLPRRRSPLHGHS